MKAAALHDALWIAARLQAAVGTGTPVEIHTFAYLARLLHVYEAQSDGEWAYRFAATSNGAPYARDLTEAIEQLAASGSLIESPDGLALSEHGRGRLDVLSHLLAMSWRVRYLEPAVTSALVIPLPAVTAAVLKEPQLRVTPEGSPSFYPLLDRAGQALISPYLRGINSAMESIAVNSDDLLPVAVSLVEYLRVDADSASQS